MTLFVDRYFASRRRRWCARLRTTDDKKAFSKVALMMAAEDIFASLDDDYRRNDRGKI
jgi:hypothetical protein